jgi:hypothetical protein
MFNFVERSCVGLTGAETFLRHLAYVHETVRKRKRGREANKYKSFEVKKIIDSFLDPYYFTLPEQKQRYGQGERERYVCVLVHV